MYSIQIN